MLHKTFIFLFVVWHCANSVNGSPISVEGKLMCGESCKETKEDQIPIEDRRGNHYRAGRFHTDSGESKTATLTELGAPKRKRQVDNVTSDAAVPALDETSEPDIVKAPEPPKNEIDSVEYKKAEENLLSASERVTDAKISSDIDGSSNDNPMTENETLPNDNNQNSTISSPPQTDSSLDEPKLLSGDQTDNEDALKTEILNESTKTESVAFPLKEENDGENDTLPDELDSLKAKPTSDEPTESKLKASVQPMIVGTAIDGDSSTSTIEDHTNEPMDTESSDKSLTKSGDDDSKEDTLMSSEDISKSAESHVEAIEVNTTETDNSATIADTTTENKSISADIEPSATKDDDNRSTLLNPKISNGINSVNNPSDLLDGKVITDEKSPIADSLEQDTKRKLDTEAETEPFDHLKKVNVADPLNTQKTSSSADTSPPSTSIPHQAPTDTSNFDNKAEPPTKEFHRIYFENEHDRQHAYDFDNFDEEIVEKDSFDDQVDDPCSEGCEHSKFSTDYDNVIIHDRRYNTDYNSFEEPCSYDCDQSEYSTNYDNAAGNNYNQASDNVEYGEHNNDASRQFFDEVDSENDFDDLFDAEIAARRNNDKHLPCKHFHTDDDEFDDDHHGHHDHYHHHDHHDHNHHDDDHDDDFW